MKKTKLIILIILFTIPILSMEKMVFNISLWDINNNEFWLPLNNKKNTIIFYNDYRKLTENKKFYNRLLKSKKIFKKINVLVIVNMKPALYLPNSFIKFMLADDVKGNKPTFCFDKSRSLEAKWRLRNCDNKSVIIIISKNKKMKYLHYGKMGNNEIKKAFNILNKLFRKNR